MNDAAVRFAKRCPNCGTEAEIGAEMAHVDGCDGLYVMEVVTHEIAEGSP